MARGHGAGRRCRGRGADEVLLMLNHFERPLRSIFFDGMISIVHLRGTLSNHNSSVMEQFV